MGSVGRESLLFGNLRFELRKHGIEGIGELPELISAARQSNAVGERSLSGYASCFGDSAQRSKHPAREKPSSKETEYQQEHPRDGSGRSKITQKRAPAGRNEDLRMMNDDYLAPRHISQEEYPHHHEQQSAREYDEGGVAECQFEANAHTGSSFHGLLIHER